MPTETTTILDQIKTHIDSVLRGRGEKYDDYLEDPTGCVEHNGDDTFFNGWDIGACSALTEVKKIIDAAPETDPWAMLAEAQEKLRKIALAFEEIDPSGWNDGCSCCMEYELGDTVEWKTLATLIEGTRPDASA